MVQVPDYPSLMEAALLRDTLATRLDYPHPEMAMAQCCRLPRRRTSHESLDPHATV